MCGTEKSVIGQMLEAYKNLRSLMPIHCIIYQQVNLQKLFESHV